MRSGKSEIVWIAREPQNLEELRTFLCELFSPLGVAPHEVACFAAACWCLATSSPERRLGECENQRWWEFISSRPIWDRD